MVRVYQVFGERVYLFVLVGEVCLGYSRARYRRPSPGFDPAHPRFSIGIVWIGGMVESTYTIYNVLVLTELRRICGTGAQGDGSLLNALSRKCYMHMLQYVHRGTLP